MYQALQQVGVQFEYQVYIPFKGCGIASETAYAYPDFVVAMPWGNLIIECDETQHTHYPPSCDVRRDFDIAASIALGSGQKLVILRYNPDAFPCRWQVPQDLSEGSPGKAVADHHRNGGAKRPLHQALPVL